MRVMLVDRQVGRSAILQQALSDLGNEVVAVVSQGEDLLARVAQHDPDIVLIDMDSPDRDTLESMREITRGQPRPVVMFAERTDEATIEAAVKAGVSAYVVDGLSTKRLQPIMQVAIARFREFQALRSELDEARGKLADRRDVDRAKGLLMQNKGMSEEDAYAALRKMAMDRNQRLGEMARNLLAAAELLS